MSQYQGITDYAGSLYGRTTYQGIEYDPEVPDNVVMTSPGGLDSTHHHYSKGFYGYGGSGTDKYAGQGYRYPAAEFGNLYSTGQGASTQWGMYAQDPPDYNYVQNMSAPASQRRMEGAKGVEHFTDIDMGTDPSKDEVSTPTDSLLSNTAPRKKISPLFLLVTIALSWVAMEYFTRATDELISTKILKGRKIDWKINLIIFGLIIGGMLLFAWWNDMGILATERIW
jgi:hypothetical protein